MKLKTIDLFLQNSESMLKGSVIINGKQYTNLTLYQKFWYEEASSNDYKQIFEIKIKRVKGKIDLRHEDRHERILQKPNLYPRW